MKIMSATPGVGLSENLIMSERSSVRLGSEYPGGFVIYVVTAGTSVFLWPFPVSTSLGDGLRFPSRVQEDLSNYQSIGEETSVTLTGRSLALIHSFSATAACQRPLHTTAESPRFSRMLVNPVLGTAGKVETMVSISAEGDNNGQLTELKVER